MSRQRKPITKIEQLTVTEVSLVPHGANQHAKVVLIKSGEPAEDDNMTDLEKRAAEAEDALARMTVVASLTDVQKAAFNAADADTQSDLLDMTPESRTAKLTELAKAGKKPEGKTPEQIAEEARAAERAELAKAGVPEAIMKRLEAAESRVAAAETRAAEAETIAKAEQATRKLIQMSKAVEATYGNLPGDLIAKAKAMTSLEALPEADRKVIETMLKAGDAAMASGMRTVGKAGVPGGPLATGSATAKLTELAKARYETVAKSGAGAKTYADCYLDVVSDNPDLYAQSEAERGA